MAPITTFRSTPGNMAAHKTPGMATALASAMKVISGRKRPRTWGKGVVRGAQRGAETKKPRHLARAFEDSYPEREGRQDGQIFGHPANQVNSELLSS
jgi:hypothetical protein